MVHSTLKGAFWAVIAALCFSTLMTLNKYATNIPVPLMIWGRCFFAACTIIPFLKIKTLTHCLSLQLLRGFFVVCAMLCTYAGYQFLNLHEAAILGTAGPLIIILVSTVLLKEKLSPKGWAIFSLGYIGVAIIMLSKYFQSQDISAVKNISPWYYKLLVLGACFFSAFVVTLGRLLSMKKVSSQAILWYGTICPLVAYTLYLPFSWTALNFSQWITLISLGVFGAGSAGAYLIALSYASASFLAPFEYLRPVFLIPIGMVFWGKYPTLPDYIGGTLIIFASLWITYYQKEEEKKKLLSKIL